MTRRYKKLLEDNIHLASPEQLLLLTIFGEQPLRKEIDSELDRRARNRSVGQPTHTCRTQSSAAA